jgi:hypothetical protein
MRLCNFSVETPEVVCRMGVLLTFAALPHENMSVLATITQRLSSLVLSTRHQMAARYL